VPFKLEGENGFLNVLKKRILDRKHALVVVAEGAGQELLSGSETAKDASGNALLNDIGQFMRDEIVAYFKKENIPVVMRYIDPSYLIRSSKANAEDSILCDLFARNAVHAAMAGKTGLVIGYLHDKFIHVPIELLTSQVKALDVSSFAWKAALATTGQPEKFE
jgi:6-phosphofructokinase 1